MDEVLERFTGDIKDHQLEIVSDNGTLRYLKFRRPNTSSYHFNITTWPGYLCISGDMETFVFSREPDMFEFFRGQRHNPQYWAEKCTAGKCYDHCADKAMARLAELVQDGYIPADHDEYEHLNYDDPVEIFNHLCEQGYEDAWDLRFTGPLFHYEWALRAIVWGIAQYDAQIASLQEASPRV